MDTLNLELDLEYPVPPASSLDDMLAIAGILFEARVHSKDPYIRMRYSRSRGVWQCYGGTSFWPILWGEDTTEKGAAEKAFINITKLAKPIGNVTP
jgi:hypothetical protein